MFDKIEDREYVAFYNELAKQYQISLLVIDSKSQLQDRFCYLPFPSDVVDLKCQAIDNNNI